MNPDTSGPQAVLDRRRAGVLLHPTSLPEANLGSDARRFIDFLAQGGFDVWQTLPIHPTHDDGSPYHGLSVHAGDLSLLSFEEAMTHGWLLPADVPAPRAPRQAAVACAYAGFRAHATADARDAFAAFTTASDWLEDYVLFQVLREMHGHAPWWQWPQPLRDREAAALATARARWTEEIERGRFAQFLFEREWQAMRDHACVRGVRLFGDMPIFVAHDSADVWAYRGNFRLDERGQPQVVAGVPPDYFSKTGQRWGNPLYDWERLATDGFQWWLARFASALRRFDLVRIDHFRGFEACWEIPATEETAANGRWVKVPGTALFSAVRARFGRLPLVAEDLGLITPEVHALRRQFGLPGMAVLQFAFDGGTENPYLPANLEPDTVVYTGTHDNDTTLSWYQDLTPTQQARVRELLPGDTNEPMPWPLVQAALDSVAQLAMVPLQDLLELGAGHRMNTPGTSSGNWCWRFTWNQVGPDLARRLRARVEQSRRGARS